MCDGPTDVRMSDAGRAAWAQFVCDELLDSPAVRKRTRSSALIWVLIALAIAANAWLLLTGRSAEAEFEMTVVAISVIAVNLASTADRDLELAGCREVLRKWTDDQCNL